MLGRQFCLYLQDEPKCDLWHIAKSRLEKLFEKKKSVIKKLDKWRQLFFTVTYWLPEHLPAATKNKCLPYILSNQFIISYYSMCHVYTKQVKQSHIYTFRGAKVNENTEN